MSVNTLQATSEPASPGDLPPWTLPAQALRCRDLWQSKTPRLKREAPERWTSQRYISLPSAAEDAMMLMDDVEDEALPVSVPLLKHC